MAEAGYVTVKKEEWDKMNEVCHILCDVDWCIGYELKEEDHLKFDEARTKAYLLLYGDQQNELPGQDQRS